MSRLATNLRMALFGMLRELDECDLAKLCREAREMVRTNQELRAVGHPKLRPGWRIRSREWLRILLFELHPMARDGKKS